MGLWKVDNLVCSGVVYWVAWMVDELVPYSVGMKVETKVVLKVVSSVVSSVVMLVVPTVDDWAGMMDKWLEIVMVVKSAIVKAVKWAALMVESLVVTLAAL